MHLLDLTRGVQAIKIKTMRRVDLLIVAVPTVKTGTVESWLR